MTDEILDEILGMKIIRPTGEREKDAEECKGIFFRGITNNYFDYATGKLVWKEELRLLKRMSCKGCSKCDWLFDDIREHAECGCSIILPKNGIEHGKTYRIVVSNITKDYETGYVDDWDLVVVEVEVKP